jgi:hypothetical protein
MSKGENLVFGKMARIQKTNLELLRRLWRMCPSNSTIYGRVSSFCKMLTLVISMPFLTLQLQWCTCWLDCHKTFPRRTNCCLRCNCTSRPSWNSSSCSRGNGSSCSRRNVSRRPRGNCFCFPRWNCTSRRRWRFSSCSRSCACFLHTSYTRACCSRDFLTSKYMLGIAWHNDSIC